MLSLSPITRSLFQSSLSGTAEHEVPVTPEFGSPTAALITRRRLSPASPAVIRRQLAASPAIDTAPSRQEPAAEGLPSPLENYSMKLSKYYRGATPSPLLREALSGRKRKSSATNDTPTPELVHPGAGKREGHNQRGRAKKPSLISPVPHAMSAKQGRRGANIQVPSCREDQVVPVSPTQVDEDISRRLPSVPQLGTKPLMLFGGDENDIFATWED